MLKEISSNASIHRTLATFITVLVVWNATHYFTFHKKPRSLQYRTALSMHTKANLTAYSAVHKVDQIKLTAPPTHVLKAGKTAVNITQKKTVKKEHVLIALRKQHLETSMWPHLKQTWLDGASACPPRCKLIISNNETELKAALVQLNLNCQDNKDLGIKYVAVITIEQPASISKFFHMRFQSGAWDKQVKDIVGTIEGSRSKRAFTAETCRGNKLVSWLPGSDFPVTYAYGISQFGKFFPDVKNIMRLWNTFEPISEHLRKLNSRDHRTKYAPAGLWLSNCGPVERRNYLKELLRHTRVDSYGSCPSRSKTLPSSEGSKQYDSKRKLELLPMYKFHISFEGATEKGYISEKYFAHWRTPSLLVYFGDPDIDSLRPGKHSFINVHNFESPRHLAAHLNALDKNDTAYLEYFKWRPKYSNKHDINTGFLESLRHNFVNKDEFSIPCRICTALRT